MSQLLDAIARRRAAQNAADAARQRHRESLEATEAARRGAEAAEKASAATIGEAERAEKAIRRDADARLETLRQQLVAAEKVEQKWADATPTPHQRQLARAFLHSNQPESGGISGLEWLATEDQVVGAYYEVHNAGIRALTWGGENEAGAAFWHQVDAVEARAWGLSVRRVRVLAGEELS